MGVQLASACASAALHTHSSETASATQPCVHSCSTELAWPVLSEQVGNIC